jgi:hypothetical protein
MVGKSNFTNTCTTQVWNPQTILLHYGVNYFQNEQQ